MYILAQKMDESKLRERERERERENLDIFSFAKKLNKCLFSALQWRKKSHFLDNRINY
jgi:hypothetical protein